MQVQDPTRVAQRPQPMIQCLGQVIVTEEPHLTEVGRVPQDITALVHTQGRMLVAVCTQVQGQVVFPVREEPPVVPQEPVQELQVQTELIREAPKEVVMTLVPQSPEVSAQIARGICTRVEGVVAACTAAAVLTAAAPA